MALNIQGRAHCCALEYDWASLLLCFCEDDGSTAIVGTRSLGRSISKLALPPSLTERFLVWFGIYTVALILLGWARCTDKTLAL